jgi:hypothetical protein
MPTKTVAIGQHKIALDARPDRLDLRDRPYRPLLRNLPPQSPSDAEVKNWLPRYAGAGLLLDQGVDGACTGFGLAAVINFQLFLHDLELGRQAPKPWRVSPAMLYQLARLYDEWPGEDYEGSSCRGALKGWHRHGVCRSDVWPFEIDAQGNRLPRVPKEDPKRPDDPDRNWDVDALACTLGVYYRVDSRSVVDMQAALRENFALYVSATVHEGWNIDTHSPTKLRGHADLARIRAVAEPKQPGGHAFALVGYNEFGFVVQNSWGPAWGSLGFALLPYEDWVTHGNDAWVLTLGVPRQQAVLAGARKGSGRTAKSAASSTSVLRSPRFLVPSGSGESAAALERPAGLIAAEDALSRRYRSSEGQAPMPLDTDEAYRHTVVLDRGFLVNNDVAAPNREIALDRAALEWPQAWMAEQRSDKLMIYAHGGLNSEEASITRIRAIAPYCLAAGVYPLFISWRSGPLETLSDLVEECLAKFGLGAGGAAAPARGFLDRVAETTDRMLEPLLRGPGGAMWGQMKTNAVRASQHQDGGVRQLVARLRALKTVRPGLEIHPVGHSAGSIVLGPMLGLLGQAGLKAASVRLFAPACTAGFALEHYAPAVGAGVLDTQQLHIHLLSDQNERDDTVGPYQKSLLYLVSRAFEDYHKEPLLGMEKCFSAAAAKAEDDIWSTDRLADVKGWQKFWNTLGPAKSANLHVLEARSVSTGTRDLRTSHGCFDNAVDIMAVALSHIAGKAVAVQRLDY